MRALKLISRFYKQIFFANFLISLSCFYLLRQFGGGAFEIIGALFWFKIITVWIILYSTITYKKKELYYYQNLGVSKLMLGLSTSLFDFFIWLVLIIITFKFNDTHP